MDATTLDGDKVYIK